MTPPKLHLSGDPGADRFLSQSALALVIGMVLDQQVPLERAFTAPAALRERIGDFDAKRIATMDPDELAAQFSARPALHRYPGSMARRVQAVCQVIVDDYGGQAANIWKGAATGSELWGRVKALPGFGDQKARIFVALLAKQLGVRPPGWESVSEPYSQDGRRSVADIVDQPTMTEVRDFKRSLKRQAREEPAPPGRSATRTSSGPPSTPGAGRAARRGTKRGGGPTGGR